MVRVKPGGEEPIGGDHGQIEIIRYRDQLCVLTIVEGSNPRVIARIELDNAGGFVNEFWFVVTHSVDLVRDLLEIRPPDRDPHRLLATEVHS